MLKTAADRDLVDAVRAAMRGESFLYPAATAALVRDWIEHAGAGEDVPEDPLTTRELQVLKLIAEAAHQRPDRAGAGDRETDGRAPPREHPRQAAHARPRRADALRDPPRASFSPERRRPARRPPARPSSAALLPAGRW